MLSLVPTTSDGLVPARAAYRELNSPTSSRRSGMKASTRRDAQVEARFSASLREPPLGHLWRSLQAGSS